MKKYIITFILLLTSAFIQSQGLFDRLNNALEKSSNEEYRQKGFTENQINMINRFNKSEAKGELLKNEQSYKEAILKFDEALDLIQFDTKVRNHLLKKSFIYYYRADCNLSIANNSYSGETYYWNAIHDFKKFINSNSHTSEIHLSASYFLRGMSYESVGRIEQACSDYKQAKKLGFEKADDSLDELNCY